MASPKSLYNEKVLEQIYQMCLLGLTNDEMAAVIGVTTRCLEKWAQKNPELREAMRNGKSVADAKVAAKLYDVAANEGNVTACIFWLKNRQPQVWRDKVEKHHVHEHKNAEDLTDAELARIVRSSSKGAAEKAGSAQEPDSVH